VGSLRDRHGVDIRFAAWTPREPHEELARQLVRAIDARTRLVAVSHASYATGGLIPLAEVIEAAHRHGALVLVDGAQTAGVHPIDLRDLPADLYTVSGQKWLCGPEGTGALYASPDALDRVAPTVLGWASVDTWELDGSFVCMPDATRYEVGTRSRPLVAGFAAALRWSADVVGRDWAARRTRALGEHVRQALAHLPSVEVLTPPDHLGLVSFRTPLPPEALVSRLADRGLIVRAVDGYDCARVCVGFFHTDDEVDDLIARIAEAIR
jgi:L-cysteine/cystine lyase